MRTLTTLLVAATALSLTGCSRMDSGMLDTEGMSADYTLEADGTGQVLVRAVLKAGDLHSSTFVDLTDGDRLHASGGGDRTRLYQREGPWDLIEYSGFLTDASTGGRYRIALDRPERTDARNSVVELPVGFDIEWPLYRDVYFPDVEPIEVAWDRFNTDDPMTLLAEGDCIEPYERRLSSDRGEAYIEAGELWMHRGWEQCTVTIRLIRARTGSVDRSFGEGRIEARQIRTVDIRVRR